MRYFDFVRASFVILLTALFFCNGAAFSAPGSQLVPLTRTPERIGSLGAAGIPVKLSIGGRTYAGTYLSSVSEVGLARRSGLRQTDVLIYVNQRGTMDPKTAQRVVSDIQGGSNTNVSFARNVRGTYQFGQIVTSWGIEAVKKQTPNKVNSGPKVTPSASQVESIMFSLVNAERAKNKLGPLSSNSKLAGVAQKHAEDMHTRKFFSHYTEDGKNYVDRANAAGIDGGIGENLEKINLMPTADQMATQGHKQFMNSAVHRANLLNPAWTSMGIGTVYEGDGTLVVVQMFHR
jgi:Uncharacterized protein with SCP/PR1 domains